MFSFEHLLLIALFYIWSAGTGVFYIVLDDDLAIKSYLPFRRRIVTFCLTFGWPAVVVLGVFQEIQFRIRGN